MIRLLQITVSVALFVWLLNDISIVEMGQRFNQVQWHYFLVILPLVVFDHWLMSEKWRLLVGCVNLNIPSWQAFKLYQASGFVGMFLPATVGADFTRAALFASAGYQLSPLVSSILVERILGFAALLFCGLVGFALMATFYVNIHAFDSGLNWLVLFSLAGLLVLFVLSLNQKCATLAIASLTAVSGDGVMKRVCDSIVKLYKSYLLFASFPKALVIFFLLTCFETLVMICIVYLIGSSLDTGQSLVYSIAFVSIVTLLVRLPISFDGFGIYEKGTEYFLGLIGVASTIGLTVGILFHLVCIASILPGAWFFAQHKMASPDAASSTC